MSTIAEQLTRIHAAKEALSGVLVDNGITPPTTFEEYATAASGINLAYREAFAGLVYGTISALESTEITSIRDYAFAYCANLSTVSLPVATTIGKYAFGYCTSLSTISLPAATSVSGFAFRGCTNLSTVSLPVATTVETYTFEGCTRLSAVSLPVATLVDTFAFTNCTSLSTISLPAATSVASNAFNSCSRLSTISLPAATAIGSDTFRPCTALSSLDISSCQTFTTPFRTSYSSAAVLSNLVSLSLPSIVTISAKAFGAASTQQYTGIVDLYFPNKTVAQVKAMANYSTWYCGSGCTIHASDGSFLYGT